MIALKEKSTVNGCKRALRRKGKCGRKRKTNKRDDAKLLRYSKKNRRKTSKELKRNLDKSRAQILSSTI